MTITRSILAAAAMVLALAGTASAQIPNPSVHIGVFGGYHLVSDDADFGNPVLGARPQLNSGADFGVRIGVNINWLIGLEIEAEDVLATSTGTDSLSHGLNFRGLVVFHMVKESKVVIPFGVVGAGLYALQSDALGNDIDAIVTYGLGIKFMMADWVAFRIQADHVLHMDGYENGVANNFDFTGGFDFFVWRAAEPPPPPPSDRDRDGIPDVSDRCPDEAGPAELGGCPDMDKDGIPNIDDACVADKGPKELEGCPDTDGDGIADRKDLCPKEAGLAKYQGCPDTDGDGIPDPDDKCPKVAGVPEESGCPKKPSVEIVKKFSGAIRGIMFDTGKATIRPSSFALLDEAISVLKEFPNLTLIIEGHTDSVGSDTKNLTLSQDRADAVRLYMIQRGIDAGRLTAIGYGETKPTASNKTKTGRAENRRIEFRIEGQ